jgi:hypothetical protein
VIEKDEICLSGGNDAGDLLNLARADKRGGVGPGAALHELGSHFSTGGKDQLAELGEGLIGVHAGTGDWDGRCALLRGRGGALLGGKARCRGPGTVESAGAEIDADEHSALGARGRGRCGRGGGWPLAVLINCQWLKLPGAIPVPESVYLKDDAVAWHFP